MNIINQKGSYSEIVMHSPEYGEFIATIDTEDIPRIRMFNWMVVKNKKVFYVNAIIGDRSGFRSQIKLHQLITSFEHEMVDHINRNTLDNRKSNLRGANQTQQNINRFFSGTKYLPGVRKSGRKWYGSIREGKVRHLLGPFLSETEAHLAFKDASLRIHGERSPFYINEKQCS